MYFHLKHKADDQRWDCDKCEHECDENTPKEMPGFNFHPNIPSTTINVCPVWYIKYKMDDYCMFLFRLYTEFKQFEMMPFAGGLNDQPWWMLQAFSTMEAAIKLVEDIDDKKAHSRMRSAQNKMGAATRKR